MSVFYLFTGISTAVKLCYPVWKRNFQSLLKQLEIRGSEVNFIWQGVVADRIHHYPEQLKRALSKESPAGIADSF